MGSLPVHTSRWEDGPTLLVWDGLAAGLSRTWVKPSARLLGRMATRCTLLSPHTRDDVCMARYKEFVRRFLTRNSDYRW